MAAQLCSNNKRSGSGHSWMGDSLLCWVRRGTTRERHDTEANRGIAHLQAKSHGKASSRASAFPSMPARLAGGLGPKGCPMPVSRQYAPSRLGPPFLPDRTGFGSLCHFGRRSERVRLKGNAARQILCIIQSFQEKENSHRHEDGCSRFPFLQKKV